MRVELLFADGDPAAMPARQNLVEVLTEDAFETPIQMIAVASEADAELARRCAVRPRFGSTVLTSTRLGRSDRDCAADYGDGPVPAKPLIRQRRGARPWLGPRPPR